MLSVNNAKLHCHFNNKFENELLFQSCYLLELRAVSGQSVHYFDVHFGQKLP